jgi:hypothetical protein
VKLSINARKSKNKLDIDKAREISTAGRLRGVLIDDKPTLITLILTSLEKKSAASGRKNAPSLDPRSTGRKDGLGSSFRPTSKRNAPYF